MDAVRCGNIWSGGGVFSSAGQPEK